MALPVTLVVGSAELDLEVDADADATITELLTALAGGPVPPGTGLLVDGRRVPPDATVADAGIRAGARLEMSAADAATQRPDPGERDPAVLELWVTGGLRAGQRFVLTAGPQVLGAAPSADVQIAAPGISGRHARLDVDPAGSASIEDLRSHLGVTVDGVAVHGAAPIGPGATVGLGPVPLILVPGMRRRPTEWPARAGIPGTDGRVPFRRGPRPSAVRRPDPVAPPASRPQPAPPPRFPWAAVLAPLAAGIVLGLAFSPALALFALLGPVMALSSWADERRRTGGDRRAAARQAEDDAMAYAAAIETAAEQEVVLRRDRHPGPDVVMSRAARGADRLWERRPRDDDFGHVSIGWGTVEWTVPLAATAGLGGGADAPVRWLADVPIGLRLEPGAVLGIAGAAEDAAAVARWLVTQLAVHHGPAHVGIVVVTDDDSAERWDWCKWLPHAQPAEGGEAGGEGTLPLTVVVIDATEGLDANAHLRRGAAPGAATACVVLAPRPRLLPATCTAVLELRSAHGSGLFTHDGLTTELTATGLTITAATEVARALTGFDDPERETATGLPTTVPLQAVFGALGPSPADVIERWQAAGTTPALAVPIGATASGPLVLDLDRDGPHGLLGGSTGAGKSQLLRTLVLTLAASVSPESVSFLLIDFKGGSAFGELARLPHTVGLVTDLDDHLAARALRSLEAEIRRRERLLRASCADDLRAYLRAGHAVTDPLPRLVVVIDEFATLASELPGFVDALVDVAQRGRSLGLHLLLATQRPAGAVSPSVRANTAFRIALRMHDDADSVDVIGTPAAARIGRATPGRAYLRTEQGDVVAFQAATTDPVAPGCRATGRQTTVRPFAFARPAAAPEEVEAVDSTAPLTEAVDLLVTAAQQGGFRLPPRPWLDPLPEALSLDALRDAGGPKVALGLVDDPDHQCRHVFGWTERTGNVAFLGDPASGVEALVCFAAALADRGTAPAEQAAPDVQVYGLDFGGGGLRRISSLPVVGAVIGAGERERQERVIGLLATELDRRRTQPGERAGLAATGGDTPADPTIVVLIDNYAAFHAAFDDVAGLPRRDQLVRTFADGPAFGIFAVVAADRPSAIPPSVAAAFPERVVFRLADPLDAHLVGVAPAAVVRLGRGRGIHLPSGLEVQMAAADIGTATGGRGAVARRAPGIEVLPEDVPAADLPVGRTDGDAWLIPVGLADRDLQPAGLRVGDREPVLVAGPRGSGRSTFLVMVGMAVGQLEPGAPVAGIALRPSPLRALDRCARTTAEVDGLIDAIASEHGPRLLLIDDGELVDPGNGRLTELIEHPPEGVRIVAAARSEAIRNRYGHWTATLRRSGTGVLLRPQADLDAELWPVALPRRRVAFPPGRGYLVVEGTAELVQFASVGEPAGESMKRVVMGRPG